MSAGYYPESIIFAVDVDAETSLEGVKGSTRLEILKHCIGLIVQTKRKINPRHKYGLAVLKERAYWDMSGLTQNPDVLMSGLQMLQPTNQSYPSFDIGSLVQLVQPVMASEEAEGSKVRVVVVYCRSGSIPTWTTHQSEGLCIDVVGNVLDTVYPAVCGLHLSDTKNTNAQVYVHDKPVPGHNCPQEAYSFLEDNVDILARRAGYTAYVFETSPGNIKKMMNLMVWLLTHPGQRPAQAQLKLPVDLALGTAQHPAEHMHPASTVSPAPSDSRPSYAQATGAAPSPPPPMPAIGTLALGVPARGNPLQLQHPYTAQRPSYVSPAPMPPSSYAPPSYAPPLAYTQSPPPHIHHQGAETGVTPRTPQESSMYFNPAHVAPRTVSPPPDVSVSYPATGIPLVHPGILDAPQPGMEGLSGQPHQVHPQHQQQAPAATSHVMVNVVVRDSPSASPPQHTFKLP